MLNPTKVRSIESNKIDLLLVRRVGLGENLTVLSHTRELELRVKQVSSAGGEGVPIERPCTQSGKNSFFLN